MKRPKKQSKYQCQHITKINRPTHTGAGGRGLKTDKSYKMNNQH